MFTVGVFRDDSCPEKFRESAFLDMMIKEAGLAVKEMLSRGRFPLRQMAGALLLPSSDGSGKPGFRESNSPAFV